MASQTNVYAQQYLQQHPNLPAKSRFRSWTPVTVQDIRRYIGLILTMGLLMQLDMNEYWTTDPVTQTPFFPATMTRDRFLQINSFFHLNDNSLYVSRGQEGHDPTFKLGEVFRRIVSRFSSCYTPQQRLSLDEGMIPWRGKLAFRVYNPDKPIKYGVKMFMLCDASNGYCMKLQLYTRKRNSISQNGATYDTVFDLLRGYFDKGYHLYCDNYYASPQLFWDLWQMGVGATGTVRSNRRGVPQQLKDTQLGNRGDVSAVSNGPLSCIKYMDSKCVLLLSTTHTSAVVATGKRSHTGEEVRRPQVVVEYNKYMGGVDRTDQMVATSTGSYKTQKWWKKVFFHVINVAVLNAYLLYKMTTSSQPPLLQRQFRRQLVQELREAAGGSMKVTPVGRPATKVLDRLSERHFIQKAVPTASGNSKRSCIVCNPAEREILRGLGQQKRRPGHLTSYNCKQCHVPLCVEPCFELYHRNQQYILAYKRWKQAQAPLLAGVEE